MAKRIKRSVGMEDAFKLEEMIDRHGLVAVLHQLARIADDKAEHVLHNWQDAQLAKAWQDGAGKLTAMANTFEDWLGFTVEVK